MEPYVDRPQPDVRYLLLALGAIVSGSCCFLGVVLGILQLILTANPFPLPMTLALVVALVVMPLLLYRVVDFLVRPIYQLEYTISDGLLHLRVGSSRAEELPLAEIEAALEVSGMFGLVGSLGTNRVDRSYANRASRGVLLILTRHRLIVGSDILGGRGRHFDGVYVTPSDPQQFIAALRVAARSAGA